MCVHVFLHFLLSSPSRAVSVSVSAEIIHIKAHPTLTELSLVYHSHLHQSNSLNHLPGQYIYINIPEISPIEWHPYVVTSSPLDGEIVLLIKDSRPGSFANRVAQLSRQQQRGVLPNSNFFSIEQA
jgi:NAD(P)H-flavin reductase